MKSLIVIFCMFVALGLPLTAADYYSKASGYLNSTSSWSSTRDGTGSSPSNFTADNQKFYVQYGHTKTANGTWAVSGTQSWVIVETGGQITSGAYDHNIILELRSGATYEMDNDDYSSLTAVNWDAASTFIFDPGTGDFEQDISYGNLTVRSGRADVTGSSGLTVRGTLTVEDTGVFDGGASTSHTNSIANINVTSGNFYGSGGSANVIYYISGNVSVSGSGSFYGSRSSGAVTFNVSGDFTVASAAWFYATYRVTSTNPSNTYNIAGSLQVPGSNYFARNLDAEGYPSFYLSGVNKTLALGSATSTLSCQHNIQINSGASYTLTQSVSVGRYCQMTINGTLKGENYQIKQYGGYDPSIYINGRFYTKRSTGLVGTSTDAFYLNSPANLYTQSGCWVVYDAEGPQTISSVTYYTLYLDGSGDKTMHSSGCTVETSLNVNAPLVIPSSTWLMVRGSMSSTSTITGGKLNVAGTSSTLNLPAATLDYITLNRPNGLSLTGYVTVTDMYLQNGAFRIQNQTMQLKGSISWSSGSLVGTSSSFLVIGGTGDMHALRAITLGTLSIIRPNGCLLTGNVTTNDIYLSGGDLNIGSNTLQINGALNISSGDLVGGTTSNLTLVGNATITIPALTLNTFNQSRNNTVTMSGNLNVNTLQLNSGSLNVSSKTLTINTRLQRSGGILFTGYTSTLAYNSSSYALSLPSLNLSRLDLNTSMGCTLEGTLNVVYLNLSNGNLSLADYTLYIMGGMSFTSGTISGSSSSVLNIRISSATVSLPQFSTGTLVIDGSANYSCTSSSSVLAKLQLMDGSLTPAGYLSLGSGSTIERYGGSLNGAPSFPGTINVVYNDDCDAGPEIPSGTNVLTSLKLNSGFTVNSDRDIHLNSSLILNNNAILNMDEGILYMPSSCSVTSGSGALILGPVQTSLSGSGFTLLPGGIGIGSGVEILSFSTAQSTTPQELQNGQSVGRSWDLSGNFSGTVSLTFTWDSSADNGLGFSSSNRACVMRYNGSSWVQVGDPVDVSGSNPRSITVQTTGFSEWTVGSEDTTLPVTLSSFTAIPNQLNYVQIAWITQSESNLSGFRLLRGHADNLVNAQDLGVLISATNTSSQQFYSYIDSEVIAPASYFYWLAALEMDGSVTYSHSVQVILQEQGGPNVPPPIDLPLMSVYPNPFNPVQTLRIAHRLDGDLDIRIYNNRGQKVRQLRSGYLGKGLYSLEWDGLDELGRPCASGNYLIHCHTAYEDKWIRSCLVK